MNVVHPPSPASRVVLAHPSGNQFFRHLGRSLQQAGRLAEVCTCLDWRRGRSLDRLLPAGVRAELGRRAFSEELGVPVASHPWREAGRLLGVRAATIRALAYQARAALRHTLEDERE